MSANLFRGGDWGDIFAAPNNCFGLVYCQGNKVIVEIVDRTGLLKDKKETFFPEPILFPRGDINPFGQIFVCGKGHVSGKFFGHIFNGATKFPDCEVYSTHGCDVIWTGSNFRFIIQVDKFSYWDSIDSALHPIPPAIHGSSQGFIQLLNSGPQWADLLRESVSGMFFPFELPNLFIGEGRLDPAHIHALEGIEHKNIYNGIAERPRGCLSIDGTLGIATRDQRGTYFLILERPLKDLGVPSEKPFPPKPEPPPVDEPKPKEPSMSLFSHSIRAHELWREFRVKFPSMGNTDESARQYSIKFAEQLRFSLGPDWGTKKADSGRPISKDTVTLRRGDRLTSFDLALGVGTGNPRFNEDPSAIDTTGQVFVEVTPVNHLGAAVPDLPNPDPNPNPVPGVMKVEIVNYRELAKAVAEEMQKFS